MNATLTFIAKKDITEFESRALDFLGRIFAAQDVLLQISPKGAGNEAVVTGYEARAGHEPALITKGLLDMPAEALLVYADEELITLLDEHQPGWRDKKPVVMTEDNHLYDFIDMALIRYHEETGEHIEAFADQDV